MGVALDCAEWRSVLGTMIEELKAIEEVTDSVVGNESEMNLCVGLQNSVIEQCIKAMPISYSWIIRRPFCSRISKNYNT